MTKPTSGAAAEPPAGNQPLADRYESAGPERSSPASPPSTEAPLGPLGNPRGKARAKMYAHNRRVAARRARRRTET